MKRINSFLQLSFLLICILYLLFAGITKNNLIENTKSSRKLTISQVKVTRVSAGRIIHRFFDTSPISPSGRYMALFRLPYEDHAPKPGDCGEVVLADLKTGEERVLTQSRGWEMQLGANVQWGKTDNELYFNDVDTLNWNAFAIKLNPFSNVSKRMNGTVFMVSNDGTKLASYNLVSSRFAQVGYGVVVPDEYTKRNFGPVESDGIDITSTTTGRCKRIVSIREIYEKSEPGIAIQNPENYEYYCFQVKWNPQATRLLTTIQWTSLEGGPRRRAVITMREDGSELKTAITPEQWARGGHHVNWTPDGEHLSMNLEADGRPGLEIITVKYDGSDMKIVFSPGSGHPSFHPGGLPLIITDAYPNEKIASGNGMVPIRFLNVETGIEQVIDSVFVSTLQGEFRIDAHPAWDRSGRFVVYNGSENGTRSVFVADLENLIKEH